MLWSIHWLQNYYGASKTGFDSVESHDQWTSFYFQSAWFVDISNYTQIVQCPPMQVSLRLVFQINMIISVSSQTQAGIRWTIINVFGLYFSFSFEFG